MKSVLISIQPKWCELIASGKKTVEVRKTKPKLATPFKVYIYCTKGKFEPSECLRNNLHYDDSTIKVCEGQGKVIGEFVCDSIDYVRNYGDAVDWYDCKASCLSANEIIEYAKDKNGNFVYTYGWHISDLVIYDKPRELSEFYQKGKNNIHFYYDYCAGCPNHETPVGEYPCNECDGNRKYLYTPPQSWCYVEGLE